jgi:hypothetical protein
MLTWGSSALRRRTWRSCGLAGSRAHSRKIGGVGGLPLFMLGCRAPLPPLVERCHFRRAALHEVANLCAARCCRTGRNSISIVGAPFPLMPRLRSERDRQPCAQKSAQSARASIDLVGGRRLSRALTRRYGVHWRSRGDARQLWRLAAAVAIGAAEAIRGRPRRCAGAEVIRGWLGDWRRAGRCAGAEVIRGWRGEVGPWDGSGVTAGSRRRLFVTGAGLRRAVHEWESRVIRNPAARGVPRKAPPGDTRENVSVAGLRSLNWRSGETGTAGSHICEHAVETGIGDQRMSASAPAMSVRGLMRWGGRSFLVTA